MKIGNYNIVPYDLKWILGGILFMIMCSIGLIELASYIIDTPMLPIVKFGVSCLFMNLVVLLGEFSKELIVDEGFQITEII